MGTIRLRHPGDRPRRHVIATYRLQFTAAFTLADALQLVPYLHRLGISHVYASPLLAARAGSTHGYDVVDHSRIDPALGDEAGLAALGEALVRHGMGLIVDVVPNHMCIADPGNTRWWDVLENGTGSRWVDFFDIDWGPPKPELAGKVLLPVLGEQFGRELESGALRLELGDGAFRLRHGDSWLPLSPPSWRLILEPVWRRVVERLGGEAEAAVELESILRALSHWPVARDQARARRHERDALVRRLGGLFSENPDVARDLGHVLEAANGKPGDPHSFDNLESLVEQQSYRLSHWRVAAHEINYRRFFDMNDLAAIRVERDEVFGAVHALPLAWAARGLVSGLRVDHVDGLFDPGGYLTRLRGLFGPAPATIHVEKILTGGERLPDEWPIDGTTGYEHLATVSAVLVDADNAAAVREAWRTTTLETSSFADVVYACKRLILENALAAELYVLARRLDAISEQHRYTRDFTFASLLEALREVLSCFPVYRTYVAPDAGDVSARDRQVIARAVREAARRNPVTNLSLFRMIEEVLLLRDPDGLGPADTAARRDFTLRLQQLTGPVMARGVEDTTFYRYFPLLSLAEVGGDPDRLGITVDAFHAANALRADTQPRGLSASATHDSKRGEDIRARLHVLSEVPRAWRDTVLAWREMNRPLRADDGELPDPLTETFIYATLVGGWPPDGLREPELTERVVAHIGKAMAEAKLHTSWTNRDAGYEDAVLGFVRGLLDEGRSAAFLDALRAFVSRVELPGYLNALVQVVLKVASPGVPDIFNGRELWDFSFTDPDNRRAVDFARRVAVLDDIRRRAERDANAAAAELLAAPRDGAIKAFVLHRALAARAARPAAFDGGGYAPGAVAGPLARHVVAFSRGEPGRRVLAVTGRLFAALTEAARAPVGEAWWETRVSFPAGPGRASYREALTDRPLAAAADGDRSTFALAEVFATLPVALVIEEVG
jgi:(1->4)-alpha-D-glucan 1-alpha-D-glucosylmutase